MDSGDSFAPSSDASDAAMDAAAEDSAADASADAAVATPSRARATRPARTASRSTSGPRAPPPTATSPWWSSSTAAASSTERVLSPSTTAAPSPRAFGARPRRTRRRARSWAPAPW